MAAHYLRNGVLIGISALLLAGCKGLLSSEAPPVAVRSITGSSFELEWKTSEQAEGTTVLIFDVQSGKRLDTHKLEKGIDSHWVRDLEKGEYRLKVVERFSQNEATLGIREIQVMSEKSNRLLTPEDFGLDREDRLGLKTLIAISERTEGDNADIKAFRKAREELKVVSGTLTQFFVGPAFHIENEEQIGTIEQVREHLQKSFQGLELSHGYAAAALLAIDLRLPEPEKEIPCQLSIRLFEILHPQYSGQFLWNRRPLLYEDFVEVPAFNVGKTNNYEALMEAYREGMAGMCADSAVEEYCAVVTRTELRDREFYQQLWNTIGRTVPSGGGGESDTDESGASHYAQVERMMFPEKGFERSAAIEESAVPAVRSDPEPEPVEETATEDKPEEKSVTTGEDGKEPPDEGAAPAEPGQADPAKADPKTTEPEENPEEPAKKKFFKPKKSGTGQGQADGTEPGKEPAKEPGKDPAKEPGKDPAKEPGKGTE